MTYLYFPPFSTSASGAGRFCSKAQESSFLSKLPQAVDTIYCTAVFALVKCWTKKSFLSSAHSTYEGHCASPLDNSSQEPQKLLVKGFHFRSRPGKRSEGFGMYFNDSLFPDYPLLLIFDSLDIFEFKRHHVITFEY